MKPTHFHPVNIRSLVFLCLSIFTLTACTSATTHLKITALSASPEPRIGEIVTVHTEIVSTEDEPDTTIHLFLPQGVKLIGGEEPAGGVTRWQGSLTANQPQSFDVQVCVLYEGDWGIDITAFSRFPDGSNSAIDIQVLHLIASTTSARAVPSWEYHYTQSPTRIPNTPLPEIPPTGICP